MKFCPDVLTKPVGVEPEAVEVDVDFTTTDEVGEVACTVEVAVPVPGKHWE